MFLSQIWFQPANKSFILFLFFQMRKVVHAYYKIIIGLKNNQERQNCVEYSNSNVLIMWNSKHIFSLLESNVRAGGVKAVCVTKLLKSDSAARILRWLGVSASSFMTHRRECSVGFFFLSFKIIFKLSAYWGLGPIQGLFCQSSVWVSGLQSSLFLWVALISF